MVSKRKTADKSNPTPPNKIIANVDAVIAAAPGAEVGKLAQQTQDARVEAHTGGIQNKVIEDVLPKLSIIEGRPTASSLEVAEMFGKEHKHVLEAIREAMKECPIEFNETNFRPVEYKDAKGEMRPMYSLSRDGFSILAMGFTGKRATEFKLAYIKQFNTMESLLVDARIEQERKILESRRPTPLPYLNSKEAEYVLSHDYGLRQHENAILGQAIGNLMFGLDEALSETAATEFKQSFMRDWTQELFWAKKELDKGTNPRLGADYYANIRKTVVEEITAEGKRRERLGIKVDTNKLVDEMRAEPSREHLFAFVLHLLGEFSEKRFRRFGGYGLKRDMILLKNPNGVLAKKEWPN